MKPSTLLLLVAAIFLALFIALAAEGDNVTAAFALAAFFVAWLTGFFWRDREK